MSNFYVFYSSFLVSSQTPPGPQRPTPIDNVLKSEKLFVKNVGEDPLAQQYADVIDGYLMFEGDIIYPNNRKAASNLWPINAVDHPEVPFFFNDSQVSQSAVLAGISHWEQHTCVRFTQVDSTYTQNALRFINGSGCYSFVGRVYTSPQDISIKTPGCEGLGTVAHEIGHAMGFNHEQSRSDRDEYVIVLFANILSGKENNFEKRSDNNYSVPYDYTSDMHYGSDYFTNGNGNTLVTKDVLMQELIGQRTGLSHRDKLLANKMYGCLGKWLTNCSMTSDPCLNMGYMGSNCNCVCPPGTSGSNCENVTEGYYGHLLSPCTEEITSEGMVTSPNYPSTTYSGLICTKLITAPQCKLVKATFNDFDLYQQTTSGCYFDRMEVRSTSLYEGQKFCGQEISPGTSFTSTTNQMVLYYKLSGYGNQFSANITFIDDPTCIQPTTCSLVYNNGLYTWTSPNFGSSNYPDNFQCEIAIEANEPKLAVVSLDAFSLDPANCNDNVQFDKPYNTSVKRCGSSTAALKFPSLSAFHGVFTSDGAGNNSGFNISVKEMSTNCHKNITLNSSMMNQILMTPRFPKKHPANTMCEWWIQAPTGKKVEIMFLKFRVPKSTNCWKNAVIVDKVGGMYFAKDSVRLCGSKQIVRSSGDLMKIVYIGKRKVKGFKANVKFV